MNRTEALFRRLREKGEKALVGFVSAGDPDMSTSLSVIKAMVNNGVDILELGVPFSDPTADGPVIQRSSERALKSGISLTEIIGMVAEIRKFADTPIIIFSYYNPILAYGGAKFYADAVTAGADGLLLVDLPPEESAELLSQWQGDQLSFIRLIALTTPPERMKRILSDASGFVYLVSMTGVTGSAGIDTDILKETMTTLKEITHLPVCIGFGISKPHQAAAIAKIADGVVVGSAFERIIEENTGSPDLPEKVAKLARELKDAM